MKSKLVAAIACRNQGTRLYGKPIQNLDVENGIRIIDNIIDCIKTIKCIDEIVLGISKGSENEVYVEIAKEKSLQYILGDHDDVLSRLISCGLISNATDIFRITSESPFMYFELVEKLWQLHKKEQADATFLDEIIDGCGFEIIKLRTLQESHDKGTERHRSELCSLYIRENYKNYIVKKIQPPTLLIRKDLRLTVDNPEDLALCRIIYKTFKNFAPKIPVEKIVHFLDQNPKLIELTSPFLEHGYKTMYVWGSGK